MCKKRGLKGTEGKLRRRMSQTIVKGFLENSPSSCRTNDSYLVRDSSGLSTVFCLLSSSMRVTVTSFSLSFDSVVAIGGVTPKYLPRMTCMNNDNRGVTLAAVSHPFSVNMVTQE